MFIAISISYLRRKRLNYGMRNWMPALPRLAAAGFIVISLFMGSLARAF